MTFSHNGCLSGPNYRGKYKRDGNETWLIEVVFFVMSWCTSGVGLQVLPFIDNSRWCAFFASIDVLVHVDDIEWAVVLLNFEEWCYYS